MTDCIFCKVIAKELPSKPIYEDELCLVIPDIHPQAPVHFLVLPKKHIDQFTDVNDEILLHLTKIIKKVIAEQNILGYRLVNNGKGAAVIDHMHIHILGNVDKMRKL